MRSSDAAFRVFQQFFLQFRKTVLSSNCNIEIPAVLVNPESLDWRHPNAGVSKLQKKLAKIVFFLVLDN